MPRFTSLGSLLLLCLLAHESHAAPVRMDFADAIRRAERTAPALGPRRAALEGSRQLIRAADQKLSHPPRLEVEVGPRFRSNPSRTGVDATLGLWQDLPLGGPGSARRRWAHASRGEAEARLRVTLEDVRAEAALAWIDLRLARELERIRQESLDHARSIARLAGARVRAGSVPPSDESAAKALVGRAKTDVIDAEGRTFVAETALRHLTGTRDRHIEPVGPLELADRRLSLAPLLTEARGAQPDVVAAERTVERLQRQAEVQLAQSKPLLSVGPSVTREATGDWLLLARASVPLPIVNANAVDSARARADASVQRAESRLVRANLERELDLALHEREHARELRDALKDGVIGPASEALRQALAQYEAGSIDTTSVLAARRELLSARERWAEACADVRRADVRLMRLLGRDPGAVKGWP